MRLKKIVSGGQSGVDQVALMQAKARKIETGGWATAGWRTEYGPQEKLLSGFGLVEAGSPDYDVRTWLNVRDSEATVWVGNTDTNGFRCTKKATEHYNKSFAENPSPMTFRAMCAMFEVINIAGNRLSKNNKGPELVHKMFKGLDSSTESTPTAVAVVRRKPTPEEVEAAKAEFMS